LRILEFALTGLGLINYTEHFHLIQDSFVKSRNIQLLSFRAWPGIQLKRLWMPDQSLFPGNWGSGMTN